VNTLYLIVLYLENSKLYDYKFDSVVAYLAGNHIIEYKGLLKYSKTHAIVLTKR